MKIFKYQIDIIDEQIMKIPIPWKPLCVQMQRNQLYIWAEIDEESTEYGTVKILIRGTGHPYKYNVRGEYIGTVQMLNGDLIWHVFYE